MTSANGGIGNGRRRRLGRWEKHRQLHPGTHDHSCGHAIERGNRSSGGAGCCCGVEWIRAAQRVASGVTVRSGLLTTNTITQAKNRIAIEEAKAHGAHVVWAVADHPWVEDADGAAVRVSLTVLGRGPGASTIVEVDDSGTVVRELKAPDLNADLSTHANVAAAASSSLLANVGLSHQGCKIGGRGFICTRADAEFLIAADRRNKWVVRPFLSGRDLSASTRDAWIVDFGLMEEDEARGFPLVYDRIRDRVRPERAANARESYRKFWWRFLEPRRELREASAHTDRLVATLEVSKHRFFQFLPTAVVPDGTLVCIAVPAGHVLGVLSSVPHVTWTLAAGGTLEDRPRYNKGVCFDAFPFPDPPPALRTQIGDVAEKLDAHRKAAIERDEVVTMTGMYNVVEKLKSGAALTPKERKIHEIAACGVLKDMHDELDALVAKAYGWEWPLTKEVILERLVALHDERVKEEKAGKVRWLRPDYQVPRFGKDLPVAAPDLDLPEAPAAAKKARRPAWPADVISQIGAIKRLLEAEALSAEDIAARFTGAKADIVRRHLEILLVMGEVMLNPDGRYQGAA